MLPDLTGIGRLVADPELKFTQNGKAMCHLRLVFQNRRQNPQTGNWEDGDTFWVSGTAWGTLAENVAESLSKGMEVVVKASIKTDQWEKNGEKRQAPSLIIHGIAPSLTFATARVQKAERDHGSQNQPAQHRQPAQQQTQQRQQPQDDPWGSPEPPF
jgi:single-strand DNA-binding protein